MQKTDESVSLGKGLLLGLPRLKSWVKFYFPPVVFFRENMEVEVENNFCHGKTPDKPGQA